MSVDFNTLTAAAYVNAVITASISTLSYVMVCAAAVVNAIIITTILKAIGTDSFIITVISAFDG